MGNSLMSSPCLNPMANSRSKVKLIFLEGTTTTLTGKHLAGEVMFQHPDKIICDSESFFIGHPLPCLAIDDELSPGRTYFVLPIDKFSSSSPLSASSLSALSPSSKPNSPIKFSAGDCPFQYVKADNGRVLIRVLPEFIAGLINRGKQENDNSVANHLCSTPELKKHYDLLVRPKDQTWSPKLDTISEQKIRFSPYRFLSLEWKQKEK